MNISEAAQASGLSAKAIRYYEELGLVIPARDANNSYRIYSQENIDRLMFLQQARAAGFDLEDGGQLLALYGDSSRRCKQVKALVDEKIMQLDQQVEAISSLRLSLARIAAECVPGNTNNEIPTIGGSALGTSSAPMAFTLVGESGSD